MSRQELRSTKHLPDELWLLILAHVPIAVCREWREQCTKPSRFSRLIMDESLDSHIVLRCWSKSEYYLNRPNGFIRSLIAYSTLEAQLLNSYFMNSTRLQRVELYNIPNLDDYMIECLSENTSIQTLIISCYFVLKVQFTQKALAILSMRPWHKLAIRYARQLFTLDEMIRIVKRMKFKEIDLRGSVKHTVDFGPLRNELGTNILI